ncbi:MAG: ATP-binding protein [Deltaproteobacteria bacterium]|nr:ATP-binding protein [Deltaproteobacteria bacterium]
MLTGRQQELALLEKAFADRRSHFTVCYGRRRVGKTMLLREFVKKKQAFFYSSLKTTLLKQIKEFLKEWALFSKDHLVATAPCRSWVDVFDLIKNRLGPQKTVIVLDEFQWMCGADQTLISVLQHVWDKDWQFNNRVHVILCGSSVSFMLMKVLSEKSPLFGRRTQSFEVMPFDCQDSASLMKNNHWYDTARFFMLFGGIPAYLNLYDCHLSFEQNINALSFCKNAYFVNELKFVLSEQLKQPAVYYKILRLLSLKSQNLTQLAGKLRTTTSSVIFNTRRLQDIGVIKEHKPVLADETSKTLLYKISDEYVRFYFAYIYPFRELIENNAKKFIFDSIVGTNWNAYLGRCFEDFCHKNLAKITKHIGVDATFVRSGSYWHKKNARFKQGVQIDLVIETSQRITYIGECKWSQDKVGYSIMKELDEKIKLYPNHKKNKLKKLLISSAGVTNNLIDHPELTIMTLKDFYC